MDSDKLLKAAEILPLSQLKHAMAETDITEKLHRDGEMGTQAPVCIAQDLTDERSRAMTDGNSAAKTQSDVATDICRHQSRVCSTKKA